MITKEEIENWSFAFSGIICLISILLYAGIMSVENGMTITMFEKVPATMF